MIYNQCFNIIQLNLCAKHYQIKYQIISNRYLILTFFKKVIRLKDKILAISQNILKFLLNFIYK